MWKGPVLPSDLDSQEVSLAKEFPRLRFISQQVCSSSIETRWVLVLTAAASEQACSLISRAWEKPQRPPDKHLCVGSFSLSTLAFEVNTERLEGMMGSSSTCLSRVTN